MTALLWPGDDRAGDLLSDPAVLLAMAVVEEAWLDALVELRVAPETARAPRLSALVTDDDVDAVVATVAAGAEDTGNPVVPLVKLLRDRLGDPHPEAARWLHLGLTSQDVLDTALVFCLRDAFDHLAEELAAQVEALVGLARWHRGTPMTGRTLSQHAVPITFGLKAATWLTAVLDAADLAGRLRWPVQIGGAAGTLAAAVELAGHAGAGDPVATALELVRLAASSLGLDAVPPWHTARAPFTRAADALVTCTDAYGRIANDVLVLARPEIGELREPAETSEGRRRGGSSTMPQKANPVLATLLRRAALAAPALAAQLHLAAAEAVDERSPGSWHAEWSALQLLGRRTVVAASQATELLSGLHVEVGRMRATLDADAGGLLAERRSLAPLFPRDQGIRDDQGPGADPVTYLGATDTLVDAALERAAAYVKGRS
jgi:3-carboxy-cis,cis-muconate cycloisomerase